MSQRPEFRLLPQITPENQHFWQGGERGELCFLRCGTCATLVHPPAPVCPECLGQALEPHAVSGRGRVLTFTINYQPWIPGFDPPYVIAIVELDEQPGLRLTTNIVGCPPEAVVIDMRVRVVFEEREGIWLPLFEPEAESQGAATGGGAD